MLTTIGGNIQSSRQLIAFITAYVLVFLPVMERTTQILPNLTRTTAAQICRDTLCLKATKWGSHNFTYDESTSNKLPTGFCHFYGECTLYSTGAHASERSVALASILTAQQHARSTAAQNKCGVSACPRHVVDSAPCNPLSTATPEVCVLAEPRSGLLQRTDAYADHSRHAYVRFNLFWHI